MNYYDEEIIIAGPDTKNLSAVKVGKNSNSGRGSSKQRRMLRTEPTDDDGLLQDILDHDDYENDDNLESDNKTPIAQKSRNSATQRTKAFTRPTSSQFSNLPTAKVIDNHSDSESDDGLDATLAIETLNSKIDYGKASTIFDFPPSKSSLSDDNLLKKQSSTDDLQLDITPEKWEQLSVHQDIKDLFPFTLKYTPQQIEVPYRLQPFIPEFVPAVGDVDAFLKVTTPPMIDPKRENEINEHIRKLGLCFLDEPAGEQSQPSLLNMKLRSVLTGSGVNPRIVSAALIPTAKSPKDIDKWITEVEQVHMSLSIHDIQPRKDIELLLIDWPREYALSAENIQDAYQRCLNDKITLADYVQILSQRFGIEGRLDTQADYILNVQTLFALYLAANQAWE